MSDRIIDTLPMFGTLGDLLLYHADSINAPEIADRSDLQPAVTLWPQSQVPAFLRRDEQPSDLRMTRGE